MTQLVLHGAANTRAVRIAVVLEELGVPFTRKHVDLSKNEQTSPAFLAVNPNGKVPALVVDGTPMFESLAIFYWLADRFGVEKGLWPKLDDAARCVALSWTTWETATLGKDAIRWIEAGHDRVPKEWHNQALAKAARADMDHDVALLDEQLAGKKFLLGESFSLADTWVAFAIVFFSRIGVDMAPWPNVSRWFQSVTQRPAFAKAQQPW
jgi:glutathione S-transferase